MNLITKRPIVCTLILLAAITSSRAQITVYDNLSTPVTAGNSQPESSSPTFGDSLTLSQGGTLTVFGVSIFNSSSSGNVGTILTGTMVVNFYDNTIPYSSGVLNKPLVGSATLDWDFTGLGGLDPGTYDFETFDLSGLGIVLPQHVLVTQTFTQTDGDSTRNGVALFSNPVVGSSPNTVYIKSSSTPEGLYTISGGNPGQFGYSIEVSGGGGNQPPVATPQSVSLQVNTSANITLSATDPENDPLTYSVVNNPTNGILTGTPPNVVYQPNLNYLGADAFTFKANDGQTDSAPALVSISVQTACVGGLTIIPTYDVSITSHPQAAKITNTINAAMQLYACKFTDPVTVSILFSNMNSGLGQSLTYLQPSFSYSSYFNALTADSKTTNDVTALAHITGGPNNPVNGGTSIAVRLANLRALGFTANPPAGFDSFIGLNLSLCNLDRVTINGSKYDLMAVVMHETDEVLGTSSGVGGTIAPPDLFRYTAAGARNFTTAGDNAFFSINGGTVDLARYNQDPGGDYGDWWSMGAHTPQVQDAFGTPAATPNLGVELTVLDVVGWDLVTTTPAAAPVFLPLTRTGTTLHFTWSSAAGRSYQLQYKTNVAGNAWSNLGSPIVAAGSTTTATDTTSPDKQRYYRVALLPGAPAPPAPNALQGPIGPVALEARYLLPALQGPAETIPGRLGEIRSTKKVIDARLEPISSRQQQ